MFALILNILHSPTYNKTHTQIRKQLQAKVDARIRQLRPMAQGCTEREIAILACACEEMMEMGVNPVEELLVIQVVP